MKFYVAGSTRDTHTVMGIAKALEDEGHEITFKWYDPDQPGAEIRLDGMRSEDLELIEENVDKSDVTGSNGVTRAVWSVTVRHKPTGNTARGHGSSQAAAHDVAVNMLRKGLKDGWSADPERAMVLATRELQAVLEADAVVLVWHPAIYGALLEMGGALMLAYLARRHDISKGPMTFIFRPGRDSVFWSLATTVWTTTDLLDNLREHEWMP